jgi:hypothetical protein
MNLSSQGLEPLPPSSAAQRLLDTTTAVRLRLKRFQIPPAGPLDPIPTGPTAADPTGRRPVWEDVAASFADFAAIQKRAVRLWHSLSSPFPEPRVRLMPRQCVAEFDARMQEICRQFEAAVDHFHLRRYLMVDIGDGHCSALLHGPSDYAYYLTGCFEISWDYPSLAVPAQLEAFHPEIRERESRRQQKRYEKAARLAHQSFLFRLLRLFSRLTDLPVRRHDAVARVSWPVVARALARFYRRFELLHPGGFERLEQLVADMQEHLGSMERPEVQADPQAREQIVQEGQRLLHVFSEIWANPWP